MKLFVAIVNYRTPSLTIDCLRSLHIEQQAIDARHPDGMQVAVVDSDSQDDSVPRIQAAMDANGWGAWTTLMPLDHNAGFAGANNAAIRMALQSITPPEYVLLLNPDTIVRPGAIAALLDFMENHPEAGVAGSRLEDIEGNAQKSAFRFPSILSEIEAGLRLGVASAVLKRWNVAPATPNDISQADWLSGASLMIRRSVLDDIGLLDDGYFMYYEDTDFCRTARQAGWSCWYVPESRVVHLVSQSSGIESARKPRPAYWFEARRRYFLKNHGPAYALCCDAAWIVAFGLWRIRRAIMRKPDTDPPRLLPDFVRSSVFARGTRLPQSTPRPAPRTAPMPVAVDGRER